MTDWQLLGGDPAPGSPSLIRQNVRDLAVARHAMDEIRDQVGSMQNGVANIDFEGSTADALLSVLDEVATDLTPVSTSFWNVENALKSYASNLEQLQVEAKRALARAKAADARRQRATAAISTAQTRLDAQRREMAAIERAQFTNSLRSIAAGVVDPAEAARLRHEAENLARQHADADRQATSVSVTLRNARRDGADAAADLKTEQRRRRGIAHEFDTLSNATAKRVDEALVDSLRNLSNVEKLYNKVKDVVAALAAFIEDPGAALSELRNVLEKISGWLSTLSLVASILAKVAFILGAIPGFQAAAAVLGTIAAVLVVLTLVVAALQFICTLALAVGPFEDERGERYVTMGDLAADGVGIAFSAVGAKSATKTLKSVSAYRKMPVRDLKLPIGHDPTKARKVKKFYEVVGGRYKTTLEKVSSEVPQGHKFLFEKGTSAYLQRSRLALIEYGRAEAKHLSKDVLSEGVKSTIDQDASFKVAAPITRVKVTVPTTAFLSGVSVVDPSVGAAASMVYNR